MTNSINEKSSKVVFDNKKINRTQFTNIPEVPQLVMQATP